MRSCQAAPCRHIGRDAEQNLIEYIIDTANLENKTKGKIVTEIDELEYTINVEEYFNFGECAFNLLIKKGKQIRHISGWRWTGKSGK